MKKLILLLIVVFTLMSCVTKKPTGFTYRFDGEYTGLDTLIDLKGCYVFKAFCEDYPTTRSIFMFYPNGLFVNADTDTPEELFFCFETNDNPNPCKFRSWGTYQIFGDTIKTQKIQDYGSLGSLLFYEDFKILNKKEIVSIAKYCNSKNDKGCDGYKENPCFPVAKFHSLESKRDYHDCPWLKKKWFRAKE